MRSSCITERFLQSLALIWICRVLAKLPSRSQGQYEDWKPIAPMGSRRLQGQGCTTNAECAPVPGCGYCNPANNECGGTDGDACGPNGDSYCWSGYCFKACSEAGDCYSESCNTCKPGPGSNVCVITGQAEGASCSEGEVQGTCHFQAFGYLQGVCKNSVVNDPVIGGFDGKKFHFDEVGNFTLLQEGHGWRVEATFSAAPELEAGLESKESSWTTGVRVHSPQGDLVSCSIPAVHPNTSLVTTLSWKEYAGVQYSAVVGCRVATPFMDINVYQVSGWEEALAKPEEHGWAAPFTWLNLDFTMNERLAAPVTGIMGATYPQEAMLGAGTDVARAKSVEPEGAELAERALLHEDTSFQGLSFSVVGL